MTERQEQEMVPFEYSGFRFHERRLEPVGDPTPEQWMECLRMLMQLKGEIEKGSDPTSED